MRDLQNDIDEITKMGRELSVETLKELRGRRGRYVQRLSDVAETSFMRPDLHGGTTIQNPSFLTADKKSRLCISRHDRIFSMFVRDFELDNGYFVAFPLKTVGISTENIPIIEPAYDKKNYSVTYLPKSQNVYPESNPADMRTELVFNVDSSDYVTVNGLNAVTPSEFALFDTVICEFEQRVQQS